MSKQKTIFRKIYGRIKILTNKIELEFYIGNYNKNSLFCYVDIDSDVPVYSFYYKSEAYRASDVKGLIEAVNEKIKYYSNERIEGFIIYNNIKIKNPQLQEAFWQWFVSQNEIIMIPPL